MLSLYINNKTIPITPSTIATIFRNKYYDLNRITHVSYKIAHLYMIIYIDYRLPHFKRLYTLHIIVDKSGYNDLINVIPPRNLIGSRNWDVYTNYLIRNNYI